MMWGRGERNVYRHEYCVTRTIMKNNSAMQYDLIKSLSSSTSQTQSLHSESMIAMVQERSMLMIFQTFYVH